MKGKFEVELEKLSDRMMDASHEVYTVVDYDAAVDLVVTAKQDFPTYEFAVGVWIARTGRPVVDGLCEAGVQQILASLRQDWFVRWFGDE